ncbi:outer membrane beta-barrel protein [Rufibacter sp. LB8]|uniref:outer membrane beta-barrel protein n=1 Tax=Rufibacter sp. LB8 TaxID=2777781 RepID=UPI00178C3F12|nr:outer membrane beta-barrel protein [Rufibacter sp. LB8]
MKKYFLLLLPALLALHTQAQNVKGPFIGVTTQYQNTYIINDEQYENVNYKHTFTTKWAPFGITAGYKFNENHSLQVEFIRSKQGEVLDLIDQDGEKAGEKHIDLVYYNIPVLFKYTTAGKVRFTFQVGPQISLLQKGSEENRFSRTATYKREASTFTIPQGTYLLASTEETARGNDQAIGRFNEYDLGLLAGMGLEVNLTPVAYLSANLRYHYNFVNIRKEEQINSPVDPDTFTLRQNMVVGVQVGVHFLFNTGDDRSPARHQ